MATIGNNFSAENEKIRDAFLTKSEVEYSENLPNNTELLSVRNLGYSKIINVYNRTKAKLAKSNKNGLYFEKQLETLQMLLGFTSNKKITRGDMYNFDNEVKNALAETLIDFADSGIFNDTDMIFVENQLNVMLSSIEDAQQVMVREQDIDDEEFVM